MADHLKQAEKALEARKVEWLAREQEIEHVLAAANTKLDVLMPKVEKATITFATLQTEIAMATEAKRKLEGQISAEQKHLDDLGKATREIQATKDALIHSIRDMRAEVDSGTAEYAKTERARINQDLTEARTELATAQNSVDALNVQVGTARTLLESLQAAHVEAIAGHDVKMAQRQAELAELFSKIPSKQAELVVVQRQLNEARLDLEYAITERNKVEVVHENFLRYEKIARKSLETKDTELQKRSAEIDQGARFLKNSRSFLPPMT